MKHMQHPVSSRFSTSAAVLAASLCVAAAPAFADAPPPSGVLTLSATATTEVPQDWMRLSFAVQREGADAVGVQSQLKQAVDAALAEARKGAKPGQVEVQTTGFSIYPRYNSKGAISGWQGRSELLVEGRDMAAIGALSGRIGTMTISQVGYSLSREARETVEAAVSAEAITRFKARASEQAKLFGYGSYTLREVSTSSDGGGVPQPMYRAAAAPKAMLSSAADGESLAVQAGKESVTATVTGSVQLK